VDLFWSTSEREKERERERKRKKERERERERERLTRHGTPRIRCAGAVRVVAALQNVLREAGAIPVVIQALATHMGDKMVTHVGCLALKNLADNNRANQVPRGEACPVDRVVGGQLREIKEQQQRGKEE
jgi:hypothetical protein